MNVRKDFWNMTTDELLPIVSMRPGKKYTREELREAREAFMKSLSGEQQDKTEKQSTTEIEPVKEEISEEISEIDIGRFDTAKIEPLPKSVVPGDSIPAGKNNFPVGFLYTLYTYFILPLLAIEAILVTLSAAAVVVFCNSEKNVLLCFAAAMLYTIILTLIYHQFMNGTRLGIILNRALIISGLIYGFVKIDHGYLYSGIALIAVSSLYLIFFTGHESTVKN